MNKISTDFVDDYGIPIYVGDRLRSKWGYDVIVCVDASNHFYGKLVCDTGHSCENIPYSLSGGRDHIVVS